MAACSHIVASIRPSSDLELLDRHTGPFERLLAREKQFVERWRSSSFTEVPLRVSRPAPSPLPPPPNASAPAGASRSYASSSEVAAASSLRAAAGPPPPLCMTDPDSLAARLLRLCAPLAARRCRRSPSS